MTSIFWFRRDVRLDDNPGLVAAGNEGPVLGLYVLDPSLLQTASQRRRDALISGIKHLDREMSDRGGRLRVETGNPKHVVPDVASEMGVSSVHVSAEITPYAVSRDRQLTRHVELVQHSGIYVQPPGSVLTDNGQQYKVFTPFFKKWSTRDVQPVDLPEDLSFVGQTAPAIPDADESVGPKMVPDLIDSFLSNVDSYDEKRNRADYDATSHLSVALRFGWVGPRRLVASVGTLSSGRQAWIRQLAWRDFYGHLMQEQPEMVDQALDPRFSDIAWRDDPEDLTAWKTGNTGYPFVDAAMRSLTATGFVHGRARMVAASFLAKHLLLDWRLGERFYRHHLLDGDVPQNVGNWQWVAGTGTDASPYFRIFNPITQSRTHDPRGDFIRRWIPELSALDSKWIHTPWEAPPLELAEKGIHLGDTYPWPIVEHSESRERALNVYSAAAGSR